MLQVEDVLDEERYRQEFENELARVNCLKKRLRKILKKKAKEEKRWRETEKVYADLAQDQSLRKLVQVFGDSGGSDTGLLSPAKHKKSKAKQAEKSERDKPKGKKESTKVVGEGEQADEEENQGKARAGSGSGSSSSSRDVKTRKKGNSAFKPSSSSSPTRIYTRTLGLLSSSSPEAQEQDWLREVMDERRKLAADKRKSNEAIFRSPSISPQASCDNISVPLASLLSPSPALLCSLFCCFPSSLATTHDVVRTTPEFIARGR